MEKNENLEYINLCLRVQESAMKIKEKYVAKEISADEAYKMIEVYREITKKIRRDCYHILMDQMENYLMSVKKAIDTRETQKTEGFSR